MTKIIIFDIDGTLANCEHRQHHVQQKPKRWDLFNAGMAVDTPHEDIIWLAKTLRQAGNKIVICSGREDRFKDVTEAWLAQHGVTYDGIYMRKARDSRRDDVIKAELLELIRADLGEPYMVFDDRQQVVDGWRANGIRCCQVQPGDF